MAPFPVSLLACPDCRGALREVAGNKDDAALVCDVCTLLFPVTDDIPILLPRHARSQELELPIVEGLSGSPDVDDFWPALAATEDLLRGRGAHKSWEWEDEAYWREKYRSQLERVLAGEAIDEDRWPLRFWQREFLVEGLPESLWQPGRTILDVGCGAGHNFRILLAPHFDAHSLYVAADVSLDALRLNRLRNPHSNGLYVLCSADRLPLRGGTVDLLCYFGILHHTERQAGTIGEDSRLLRPGGTVILHEAITRRSARPGFLPVENPGSQHEDTIDRRDLLEGIRRAPGLEIRAERWSHTAVMGLGKTILRRWLRGRWAYRIVAAIDVLCLKLLGSFWPQFEPAEVLLVLANDETTSTG